ncbi:MAG: hypothetical protein ABJA82_07260 [Myxococcales bacterium]
MKSAALSTILVTGLMVFGCAPADPVGGDGTGGRLASSGGNSAATGGNNASGGTTGSGGAISSGGATNTGGAPGTGGAIEGSGGRSSSGGAPGSGGATTGTGGRGNGSGGRMGMGTGGGPTGGGSGSGTSFAAVAAILGTSCGTGMCHTGTDHVDLRNMGDLRGRLVGGMPSGAKTMATCKSKTLVVANDPATSVLSQVIKAKVTGCTNARMPDSCPMAMRPCLTMAQIATIDGWIMGGAGP